MSKKILIIIAAVIFVGILVYFIKPKAAQAPEVSQTHADTMTVSIMVPQDFKTYERDHLDVFNGDKPRDPSKTWAFVEKQVTVPYSDNVMKATAQAAAEVIESQGTPEILYLKVVDNTAYVVLNFNLDGFMGMSLILDQTYPIIEKTLLQFPEIHTVVFDKVAPGDKIEDVQNLIPGYPGYKPPSAATPSKEPKPAETKKTMTTATIETTKGKIIIEFFPEDAPKTVENFLTLAKKKFYDGTIFHRVIAGFMIQGGDPTGTGRGGPGYQFADELNASTESYKRGYVRGTVAMANAGPNTNGSQFFIMHQDYALPHSYTIFGRVIEGMDVVDAIATTPKDPSDRPLTEVKMTKVTVSEATK